MPRKHLHLADFASLAAFLAVRGGAARAGLVALLVGLFLIQKHGTARIGILFGPVMVLWFVVLGALGISGIIREPQVLQALNPWWAANFFIAHPGIGVTILAAVVLAAAGAWACGAAALSSFSPQPARAMAMASRLAEARGIRIIVGFPASCGWTVRHGTRNRNIMRKICICCKEASAQFM